MTTTRLATSFLLRVYRGNGRLSIEIHELRAGKVKVFQTWEEALSHLRSRDSRGLR